MSITIEQYMANLKKAINGLRKENSRIILANQDDITEYNSELQLFEKGIDAKEQLLGVYAGFNTKAPAGSNPRGYPKIMGDKWNFLDSGNLFNSLHIVLRSKWSYEIVSSGVPYLKDLEDRSGSDNIIGLTPENALKVEIEIIKPNLDVWLLRYL